MGTVRQLANTFQPRQQNVSVSSLRIDALAPGLRDLSSSLQAGQQITAQYNQQKASAQGEKASWEMEDWLNRFLLNMDSPEKLRNAFSSTQYSSLSAGINDDMSLYDSSTAQTLYKQALELTGVGIEDDATRNAWQIAKLREWEAVEPKWQIEANKWTQEEARSTQMGNLRALWVNGFGTKSDEFNDKIEQMRTEGHFGTDATQSLMVQNDMKLSYQKSEQTALMEDVLRKNLMPYAIKGSSQEELNLILSGMDLSMDGVDYLTPDEKSVITKKWSNHASNYSKLYTQKVAEGHTQWVDSQWQMIQDIKVGSDLEPAERVALAQQKVDELITRFNSPLTPHQTGIPDMSVVELGPADGDDINDMIESLNLYIGGNGDDTPADKTAANQALNIAWNTLGDPGLSPSSKNLVYDQLLRKNLLTSSQYSSFRRDTADQSSELYTSGYSAANKMADAQEWDASIRSSLMKQLNGYYKNAYGLNTGELNAGISAVIQNFSEDNTDVMKLTSSWQEDQANFFAGWTTVTGGLRGSFTTVTKELGSMQHMIELGNMAGMSELEPGMFSQYATFMGDHFATGLGQGDFENINTEGLILDDLGQPKILGRLVDNFGNALIAVEVAEEGRTAPQDFESLVKRVRIFSPISQDIRRRRDGTVVRRSSAKPDIGFVEITDDDSYYIEFTDNTGQQIDPVSSSGQLSLANRVIMANTGKYTALGQPILESISIDPESILRSQRGTNPFR